MITLHPSPLATLFRIRLVIPAVCLILMLPGISAGDDFDSALEQLATYEFGDNREILSTVEDYVRSSADNAEERRRIEKEFSKLLTSQSTHECKDFICRQLWTIGTNESVPALASVLAIPETSDIARYALQENPSEEAGKTLRDALKKTEGLALIGIINSIGNRGDVEAVTLLSPYVFAEKTGDTEKEDKENESIEEENQRIDDIAVAAIAALGRIPSNEAGEILAQARNSGCPVRSHAASEALLIWADTYLAENDK